MKRNFNLPNATLQDVNDVIYEWCNDDVMFTKFDVTKQLRHKGFMVMHKDVKRIVERDVVFPGGYDTSTITIGNSTVILFHPDGADTNDYDPDGIDIFVVDNTTNATTQPSTASANKQNYSFDRHGQRYSVKASFARQAGFPAGASVYVKIEPGKIILNKSDGRSITADRYANIRIPKSDFKKAFSTMPTEIKVEIGTDQIEIMEN